MANFKKRKKKTAAEILQEGRAEAFRRLILQDELTVYWRVLKYQHDKAEQYEAKAITTRSEDTEYLRTLQSVEGTIAKIVLATNEHNTLSGIDNIVLPRRFATYTKDGWRVYGKSLHRTTVRQSLPIPPNIRARINRTLRPSRVFDWNKTYNEQTPIQVFNSDADGYFITKKYTGAVSL